MDDQVPARAGGRNARHLAQSIDKLLASGQVTEDEAARLRAGLEHGAQDEAVRDIRVRHAGAILADAVRDGRMTQEEADGYLQRLRAGEHSRSLRAHLRGFRRPSSPRAPGGERPEPS
jgi:polyhydroxyalkanoate synthesis regulator phasin